MEVIYASSDRMHERSLDSLRFTKWQNCAVSKVWKILQRKQTLQRTASNSLPILAVHYYHPIYQSYLNSFSLKIRNVNVIPYDQMTKANTQPLNVTMIVYPN